MKLFINLGLFALVLFSSANTLKSQATFYCDWGPIEASPFNWQTETYQMYIYPNYTQTRQSPFHATGANLSQNIFDLAWYSDKDYNEADG